MGESDVGGSEAGSIMAKDSKNKNPVIQNSETVSVLPAKLPVAVGSNNEMTPVRRPDSVMANQ